MPITVDCVDWDLSKVRTGFFRARSTARAKLETTAQRRGDATVHPESVQVTQQAYTTAWERKLIATYNPNQPECFRKDCCLGKPPPAESPVLACPEDGENVSTTKTVCQLQGETDSCDYNTAIVTACPDVTCSSDQDCCNGSHCGTSSGLCEV